MATKKLTIVILLLVALAQCRLYHEQEPGNMSYYESMLAK